MRCRIIIAFVAALAVAGCGDSAEDEAATTVCEARDDVSRQVKQLESLTPATVTADEVREPVDAIRDDLKKISDAYGELSDDRRAEVQAANEEFTGTVRSVAGTILRSTSVEEAGTQLSAAADQLRGAYESSLATIECD